jgi:hypothetical protein
MLKLRSKQKAFGSPDEFRLLAFHTRHRFAAKPDDGVNFYSSV